MRISMKRWKPRYRLGVLSDAMPSLLKFMEQWDILRPFDAAVISTQVGAIKPDPRMYAAILDKLGADPGDCLFVDDRASNLEGAVAAGMQAMTAENLGQKLRIMAKTAAMRITRGS